MNTILRNVFAGLSLSLLFAAGCGTPEEVEAEQVAALEEESAELTTSAARKRDTIVDVADPQAAELIASLQAAGATLEVVPDASFLVVKSLSCSLGTTSSSCSMIGDGRSIQAGTAKAKAIVSSLKGASIAGQRQSGHTVYKAKKVDCSIGTFTGRPMATCQVTVQTL
ncbi:MAG TPA: hypothetical protein PLW65_06210 [Pseudomonadota bacterium]|nr:hypothetical protein [Pseudomonadota bacterium]HRI49758.1 hypothetical protein [Pseudomonadota bacterium]